MVSANLLLEARRRAGLSQRELAARAGVAQQEIARYERGHVAPSLERLRRLIGAGGLELTFGLARSDSSYDEAIAGAMALEPAERLARGMRDAEPLRRLRAEALSDPAPEPADPLGVFAILRSAGVRYVLIGELAEVLSGSPLLPVSGAVTIVPRAGERERLSAAVTIARGRDISPKATPPLEAIERWHLDALGMDLVIAQTPAGTRGYEDLHRDAQPLRVGADDLAVATASLVDLVRIAEASNDRSRVPALRRTLELAPEEAARARAA